MLHPSRILGSLAALALSAPFAAQAQSSLAPPPIRHVFIIVLENTGYDVAFGAKAEAPYLADSLPAAGALLRQYHGIGHYSLDNYIAMISGIAPNRDTQGDCGRYVEFEETGMAPDGQPIGVGCVYPAHVQTIANQLEAKGLTWKAYMEDMGSDPTREAATCAHPVIGERDGTQGATVKDQYATKHNPFMYFHAIIDRPNCQTNVVSLEHLEADLASAATTPNYVFISPDLCHDGHNHPCRTGEPGGMVSAGRFLSEWVPRITRSPAFRESGLLIVTFDEAASSDKTACCNEPTGPNTTSPGAGGPGGGRSGTVLVSPFIKPGTVSDVPYNHYSMLRSVEDIFGLEHLGFAGMPGLVTFGHDIYRQ
jgi:hypothetical protein